MPVQPVSEYEPRQLEEKILEYWVENSIMEETFKPTKGRLFSFLEGPPTANAPPALHHVEMRTFKDLVNRFHYMLGESVPRKAGWDCHGLPVEVQVEKELRLKDKKDIVDYGVDRFVEKCRASVFSHIREWDDLTKRMGYWIDLENPYVTMDNDYIESVWWSLEQIWKKNLLYEGHRVVPFCSRCGTPLSSHEVSLGYKQVKETTVIASFPLKNRDYSLLAWTTTPWTLLSNLALAVNPKVKYALIKYRGEKYLLASELAKKRFPEADVVEEVTGQDLVGLEYHPLFNHFVGKLDKKAWFVLAGDFVTTEEGTGVVHIAPAFGEDDYIVGKENHLPIVNPIGEDGRFKKEIPELEGVFAKDADEKIIDWLEEKGSLIAKYPYVHDYPYCWRCNTPLLYYAMKSWFIKVSDIVDDLVKKNQQISWYPETIGSGRFGNWLVNARDWSLSRTRFWGTPLPIWRCDCGKVKVVGSRKQLMQEAESEVEKDLDLHRPFVDEVKLKCSCGGKMSRVEDVIDCWYDSGAASFAQYHYPFENRKLFEESFPYDFISEATDQTRGWFYTLLVLGTIIYDNPAYISCVVGGLLLDEKGEKMSKSNKNIVDPWKLFDSVGADAVRLQMCQTAPWNAKRFGLESMGEAVLPMLRTLWNCYSFTVRYLLLDGFDPRSHDFTTENLSKEDEWILSSSDKLSQSVRDSLSTHDYHHCMSHLYEFIVEDLSRWYIKLVRDRLWLEDEEGIMNPSKKSAYMCLYRVFERVCTCLAPFAPFITEEIYLNILKKDKLSVHHMPWPKDLKIDEALISDMNIARRIFEAATRCRQEADIKLRYPIAEVTVSGDMRIKDAVESLSDVLLKQLNCKQVTFKDEIPDVSYKAIPDYSVIGPRYGRETNKVAKAIGSEPEKAKMLKEEGGETAFGGYQVSSDMISEIRLVVPKEYMASEFSHKSSYGIVLIETKRDKSLINEALARDLIRHIQELRRKNDLDELQRITVEVSSQSQITEMLGEFEEVVLEEVRGDKITPKDKLKTPHSLEFEGNRLFYGIKF